NNGIHTGILFPSRLMNISDDNNNLLSPGMYLSPSTYRTDIYSAGLVRFRTEIKKSCCHSPCLFLSNTRLTSNGIAARLALAYQRLIPCTRPRAITDY